MLRRWFGISLVAAIAVLSGFACQQQRQGEQAPTEMEQPGIQKAVAVLHPTAGSNVSGLVTFTKTGAGIEVVAHVEGLTPGKHGFHIHEYGDCSALDLSSAGGHFNPGKMPHAGPGSVQRHVGDLGNLEADSMGVAHSELTDNMLTFEGIHSIIGRAVVVHQGEDDFTTQPAGNSGARVACGVIGIAQP